MSIIRNTLQGLTENGIEYAVLRGFIPIEEVDKSKDVDIYVPKLYKKKILKYFKSIGWYHQKINCSRFPHIQFIYLTEEGIKKIDIVFGLYYSNKLLKCYMQDEVLNDKRNIENIFVLNQKNTLYTFIFHVLFDKNELSLKNERYLNLILEDYRKSDYFDENDNIYKYAELLINNNNKETISSLRKTINSYLKYNIFRHITHRVITKSNNIVHNCIKKIENKNIAVLGVDGAGKSSTIETLKEILDNNVITQYMGFKNWKNNKIESYEVNGTKNLLQKADKLFLQYIEFNKRYYKNRFKDKIVILDRFPDEAYINYNGLPKYMCYIYYKLLFPKPKRMYYLYCSVETSLSRKSDIDNPKSFRKKKDAFDKIYLNKRNVLSISTDGTTNNDIAKVLINDFNKNYLKYLI